MGDFLLLRFAEMETMYGAKSNVTVWRPSVRPSVRPSLSRLFV